METRQHRFSETHHQEGFLRRILTSLFLEGWSVYTPTYMEVFGRGGSVLETRKFPLGGSGGFYYPRLEVGSVL